MYSKFKLNVINDTDFFLGNYYYDEGLKSLGKYKEKIKNKLEAYIDYSTGYIDGEKLEKTLFKEIDTDVFLSHSHKDKDLAISIAGWLKEEMGLTAFVDSCVWSYADNILKNINNSYNVIGEKSNGYRIYDYNKANYIASHIYLMLNSALNNMINKTECLIFINTPNSTIQIDKIIDEQQTLSPWIYSEIVMANTMKITYPIREVIIKKEFYQHTEINEDVNITHKLDFSNFIDIDLSVLKKWKCQWNWHGHALDTLYEIVVQGGILYG